MKWQGRKQSSNVVDLRINKSPGPRASAASPGGGKNPQAFERLRKSAKKATEKAVDRSTERVLKQMRKQPQIIARAKKQDRLVRSK